MNIEYRRISFWYMLTHLKMKCRDTKWRVVCSFTYGCSLGLLTLELPVILKLSNWWFILSAPLTVFVVTFIVWVFVGYTKVED
jgi:hypothetical protein